MKARVVLIGAVAVALLPIAYLLSLALRPAGEVLNSSLLPDTVSFDNFVKVFDTIELGTMLTNSWVSACLLYTSPSPRDRS